MAKLGTMRYPSPEEWRDLLVEYRQSGLTQKEFAAKHEIPFSTFQYWLYVKSKKSSVSSPRNSARFLPVEVVASPASLTRAERSDVVEASLRSGVSVRFAVGTDTRYLAELLAALG